MSDQEVAQIHGQKPGSQDELMLAAALDKLDAPYIYQYEIFGGRDLRGGIVIDFLVLTPPRATPLFLNGRYWHTGKNAGEIDLQIQQLDARMAGQFSPAVVIWDDEFETVEEAMSLLRTRLGI